jgi:hypothetical protein
MDPTSRETWLGKDIFDENGLQEKQISEKDKNRRSNFCVSAEARGNNHGYEKNYNSDSGNLCTVGNSSVKVVVLHSMSKSCKNCEEKKRTRARNRMTAFPEPPGALKSMFHLHQEHDVVMELILMDTDSSS